ncbi:protein kinase C-binding protein PICK1 [Aphelenchoides avenae]|nr:protein kinase C-binding protein PICK1 [Aphelenchus avenae]
MSVRGFEKSAVAALIKQTEGQIRLSFNRLQFEPEKGQTLDIVLKKFKHRFVESMDATTADAMGLSRAILCNDLLAKLLDKLDQNEDFYKTLIRIAQDIVKSYVQLSNCHEAFGSTFCEVASREGSTPEGQFFAALGDSHRSFRKEEIDLVAKIQDMVDVLQVYATKAIPDAKLSIKKYLDTKFEYLSFCLKIKEMEDEEVNMAGSGAYYLPRMEEGNYDYRIMLRCRDKSREKFTELRKHVMVKIELLDEKHVRELALQLRSLMENLRNSYGKCSDAMSKALELLPQAPSEPD